MAAASARGAAAADQEKPFRTIEVEDSSTGQVCKVACMSCIRGHRTTSCGIPVCRPKIFWTVKRPGRPANTCTCRYAATGRCKCIVGKVVCPHKTKKGEKRSRDCHCDEKGRFCCLLEPDHWATLTALGNPRVKFYPTKEALEAGQVMPDAHPMLLPVPVSPSHHENASQFSSTISSLRSPSYPALVPPAPVTRDLPGPSAHRNTSITPQFSLMDINSPEALADTTREDVLMWQREVPPIFHDWRLPRPMSSSAALAPANGYTSLDPLTPTTPGTDTALFGESLSLPHHQTFVAPMPDFDRRYFDRRFASAICQNCGLSGCSCKNCPPVFQNFGTTSWAQSCGRKHARDPSPRYRSELEHKVPRLRPAPVPTAMTAHASSSHARAQLVGGGEELVANVLPPATTVESFPGLGEGGFAPDLTCFDLGDPLVGPDFSEFLVPDFDQADAGVEGLDHRDSGNYSGACGGCCGGGA